MVGASNGDGCKLGLIASMAATRKPLKGHYSAFDASAGLSLSLNEIHRWSEFPPDVAAMLRRTATVLGRALK